MCFKGIRAIFIVLLLGMGMLAAGVGVMDDEVICGDWEVLIDGPYLVVAGEENIWEASILPGDIPTSDFTFSWTVSGEIVSEESNILSYTFHNMGATETIEVTVMDEHNNTRTSRIDVGVYTDITVTVVDEDHEPLEDAYVFFSKYHGRTLERTDEHGKALFHVWVYDDGTIFSVTTWYSGYGFVTEEFTGVEHHIVLLKEEETLPPEESYYVDRIRMETRMGMDSALFDIAMGELDLFLDTISGETYAGHSEDFRELIQELDTYRAYNELTFNTAWTEPSLVELDIIGDGDPLDFRMNPLAVREVRFALNYLLNRQQIVEAVYKGHSIPMYQAISPLNEFYENELRRLDEKYGFTAEGDFDKAYNMIQDAMTDAMNNPELSGDMRPPELSPTRFWQYKPPGGTWNDINITALIRVGDGRLEVGNMVADLMEVCGIRVDRREGGRELIEVWLFTDPADFQWGFYTGEWIASETVAYMHSLPVQFYTDYNGFMPGGLLGDECRYYYRRDESYAQSLIDDHANPLMAGLIEDKETYWDHVRHISDTGIYHSARIFISRNRDIIPMNNERVSEVAYDATTGWSGVFSPRTVRTIDGNLTAAIHRAVGFPYMIPWNDIEGSDDYEYDLYLDMIYDPATKLHPVKGTTVPMRADYIADETLANIYNARYDEDISPGELMARRDYEFDENGGLVKKLEVPSGDDVWFYDVQTETWINGGHTYDPETKELVQVDRVASAVTYKYHLGTWHSGHELKLRDVMAWHAFSKQLCYDSHWGALEGPYYHSGFAAENRPYMQNLKAIEIIDAKEGIVTYYGDHTFPDKSEIAGYYPRFPLHPWQLYEAVTELRHSPITEYADSGNTPFDIYEWKNQAGTNTVSWISSSQTVDFKNTLLNLAGLGTLPAKIPPYLNHGPTPITEDKHVEEIQAITAWQDTYRHSWISHGTFKLIQFNIVSLTGELERHTHEDGYPFPDDHWRNLLSIKSLEHDYMSNPHAITSGEELTTDIRVSVFEEYPVSLRRALDPSLDDFNSTLTIFDEHGDPIYTDGSPVFRIHDGSYLTVTVPGIVTAGWEPGNYTLEFKSSLLHQDIPTLTTSTVLVNEPVFNLENHHLSMSATAGRAPLEVRISVGANNSGTAPLSEDVFMDGEVIHTLTVPGGESEIDEFTLNFTEAGEYFISFGPKYRVISVIHYHIPAELVNHSLITSQDSGLAPLKVEINITVENVGEVDTEEYVFINGEMAYIFDIPAESTFERTIEHTFEQAREYLVEWGDKNVVVTVLNPVPEFTNLHLDVSPVSGEAPLEDVVISFSANNSGTVDGELELRIDGVLKYTLVIPAEGSAEHTVRHSFQVPGTYNITFHDLTETVVVVEHSDTDDPLWILPVTGIIIVLLALMHYIYKSTRRPKSMGVYDEDMYGDEDMDSGFEDGDELDEDTYPPDD